MPNPFEKPPSPKKQGEKIEEEGSEKEAVEKISVEKEIPRPWETIEREEERELIEKYTPRVEFKKENQKFIDDSLGKEVEEMKIRFAKDWFEKNKEELRAEGISLAVSEKKKIEIAIERGALEDLKRKEEYREKYEEIENLNALRIALDKERLPIGSQFLLLNYLDTKTKKVNQEIQEMKVQGKPGVEIAIKEKELDRLFEAKKELAEKVSGRDLEKEAKEELETEIKPKEEKEKYIEDRLEEKENEIENKQRLKYFEKKWQGLPKEEKEKYGNDPLWFADAQTNEIHRRLREQGIRVNYEDCLVLINRGYNPEKFSREGFLFGKKIKVKEGETISEKDFPKFLENQRKEFSEEIEKRAKKELGDEWEKNYQKLIKERVEEKIRELAKSPEKAIEGVEGMYRKLKERLLVECAERDLKKEPKTGEKLKEIEKEFSQKGKNPQEFIGDILNRKGPLGELTGNLEKDEEKLREFFAKYGLEIEEGDLKKKVNLERYQREVGRERGFLELLLTIFFFFLEVITEAKKETKRERK